MSTRFDNLSQIIDKFTVKLGLDHYSLYLMDYGAPIGFRLAAMHPERVDSLIIQNGNAYVEGIDNDFWAPIKEYWKDRTAVNKGLDNDWWKNVTAVYKNPNMSNEDALRFLLTLGATKWQYFNGVRDKQTISPDNWHVTQRLLDRPGNAEIQLQLFLLLRQQSPALFELAGVLPPPPAQDADCLGRERRDIPGGGRPPVQA